MNALTQTSFSFLGQTGVYHGKVRDYARTHGLSFYNEHTHQGQLRTLIIRSNHQGEIMLIVCFGEKINDACRGLMDWLHGEFP